MGARNWAGPLLIGAVIVAGCGDDDNDSSSEDSAVVTTLTTPTTTAPTASTAPQTDPSSPPTAAVLFEEPFDDDRNGWGVVDDPEYGSTAYESGDYVWEFTGTVGHLLPKVLGDQYDRGELDMADVVVRAEATVVAGGGVIGVFCREETDVDAEVQWYEFVARDGFAAIRRADLEGNILRKLTDAKGYDAEGAYSKDGKQIAFCSDRDGDADIYVMNADGSNVRQITNAPGYDGGPFISPDGKWVVFRSDREKPEMLQIHVIGIDGKNEQPLTDNEGVNWGPYWHPIEPYIIWSGADHSDPGARPNYDLWLARYEVKDGKFQTSEPIRVTDSASADVLPVFSPDGKRLMWTSTRTSDHESQLFIADFQLPK